jgi:hypothetical protein
LRRKRGNFHGQKRDCGCRRLYRPGCGGLLVLRDEANVGDEQHTSGNSSIRHTAGNTARDAGSATSKPIDPYAKLRRG